MWLKKFADVTIARIGKSKEKLNKSNCGFIARKCHVDVILSLGKFEISAKGAEKGYFGGKFYGLCYQDFVWIYFLKNRKVREKIFGFRVGGSFVDF